MRKIYITCIYSLIIIGFLSCTKTENLPSEDNIAIEKVIKEAYIEGVFNEGSVDKIKSGWYPGCDISVFKPDKDTCIKLSAYSYIPMFEENPKGMAPGTTYKIPLIHITEYAAIAVVEIFHEDKQIYTDYINLYKFHTGWKIVTKTYYSFPK